MRPAAWRAAARGSGAVSFCTPTPLKKELLLLPGGLRIQDGPKRGGLSEVAAGGPVESLGGDGLDAGADGHGAFGVEPVALDALEFTKPKAVGFQSLFEGAAAGAADFFDVA